MRWALRRWRSSPSPRGLGAALYEARLATSRFNDVRSLATTFLFDFDKELAAVPGNIKARQLLVATAQKYLDHLASTAGNDMGLLNELATAYEKLGDVQGMPGISNLGQTREAGESYRKALGILEHLSSRDPKYRSRLITDLGRAGRIAAELNQGDVAIELASRSAKLSDQLRAESPSDLDLTRNAARSFDLLAALQRGLYHAEEAVDSGRKAVTLSEQSILPKAPPKASHQLAIALNRLALADRDLAECDAAMAADQRALGLENRILAANPRDLPALNVVAVLHQDMAGIQDSYRYPSLGHPSESIAQWTESVRMYSGLAESDPNDIRAQTNAAVARAGLALESLTLESRAKDAPAADRLSESAAGAVQAILRKSPTAGYPRSRWPTIGWVRATVLAHLGRKAEAMDLSRQALDAERKLSAGTPDDRLDLGGQLLLHAQILVQCGQPDLARQASEEAAARSSPVSTLNCIAGCPMDIRRARIVLGWRELSKRPDSGAKPRITMIRLRASGPFGRRDVPSSRRRLPPPPLHGSAVQAPPSTKHTFSAVQSRTVGRPILAAAGFQPGLRDRPL